MKKTELAIVLAIASVISLFYYGPFLDNYFVWDDFIMLENYYTKNFKEFLFGFMDLRLFGNLILWFNSMVSGFNPIGYTLIGISAHIANSAILFILIYSLSSDRLLSILTALIFAASSVGCDAIFWKCAFLTVTGLFFYLVILYLYVEGNNRHNPAFHNLALIIFFFAIFNKEEIASIPFMIILLEILFFREEEHLTSRLKRVIPYFFVIILYILLSFVVSRYLNLHQEQFERFLSFRPLHTLFSGFASFFISPDGHLHWENPFIYVTAILILFFAVIIQERKLFFFFGLGWCFLTFLPQSLTGSTQYDPTYLLNSISRHLYLPSVGPAIIFSVILLSVREHLLQKIFVIATTLFFTVFIFLNHERVNVRGRQWQKQGIVEKQFLYSFKMIQPALPENVYVNVVNGSRSYNLRSLRAFYRNPKIYWTDESRKDAYIYLYLNGRLINDHNSIMKLYRFLKTDAVGPILGFYELKGLKEQKLEFMRAISDSSHNDAEMHFGLAINYCNMKMWDEAISEFKAVLAITPDDLNAHYELGLVYMADEKLDLAMREFELVANANSPQSMMAKGLMEYIKKQ